MRKAPMSLVTIAAVAAGTLLWGDRAGSRRRPSPPPCDPARYLLPAPLLTGQAAPAGDAVQAGAAAIAIDGLCDAIAPKIFRGTRQGTRVRAQWPACPGLRGRVTFAGTIVNGCSTLKGTFKARRFRRRLTGTRSGCGDGRVDRGGGERCDPPEMGVCNDRCRRDASATIGAAGGRLVSLDGRLTLDFPPGALAADTPITIRRLEPDELSPELVALGAKVVYELTPDGLQFPVPVTATFLLDGSPLAPDGSLDGDAVLLYTADGSGPELLAEQQVVLDGAKDAITASGQLTHFSNVFSVDRPGLANLKGTVPAVVLVGASFDVSFLLTLGVPGAPSDVVHVDQTPPGPVVYTGEERKVIGQVGANLPNPLKGTVSGYSCAGQGPGDYEAEYRFITFSSREDRNVAVVLRPKATLNCAGATTTTTSRTTTTGPSTTSTTGTTTTSTTTTTAPPTTSTTTTTTTSTTTTTIPCALDGQSPPVCGGDCPPGSPTTVCRFDLALGSCRCIPTTDICAEEGDGTGICGGVCPSPNDRCALARGDERQIPPCICFRSANPCTLDDSQSPPVCGGECPPALFCQPSPGGELPCQCLTTTTTTSAPPTTSSTTTTSTTTSTTAAPITTTTAPPATTTTTTAAPVTTTSTSSTTTTTSTTTSTTTTTLRPTASLELGYAHIFPNVSSIVCGRFMTMPPLSGLNGTAGLFAGGPPQTTGFTTGMDGKARILFPIGFFSNFSVSAVATLPGGGTLGASNSINVTAAPGTCPGFAPCIDGDGDGAVGPNNPPGCDPLSFPVDCADGDPLTFPGAGELCDGVDNNCNQLVDEGCNS
jgi:hypothetical protein